MIGDNPESIMNNRKEIRKLEADSYLKIEKSYKVAYDMLRTRREIYLISLFILSVIFIILLGFKIGILLSFVGKKNNS